MLNALSRFLLLKLKGMLNFELIFNLYFLQNLDSNRTYIILLIFNSFLSNFRKNMKTFSFQVDLYPKDQKP